MIKDSQTTDNKNKPPKTQHEIIATIFHILCEINRNLILNCDDDRYNNEETYHDIVQLYDFIGMDYDEAEDYTDALCCYNEAIELFNRFLDEDTYFGLKRDIIGDIANHYALQGEFAKAADILNAAIQEANESNKDELHSIAELYSRLGNIHIETGHYSDALSDYMKALNLRKQVFDSDDINMFGYNGPCNLDHGIEKMREHGIMRLTKGRSANYVIQNVHVGIQSKGSHRGSPRGEKSK